MKYENIFKAKFIKRLNRFVAIVEINNKEEKIHVKNTGRCEELLVNGAEVYIQFVDKETRKTKYSLISVVKNGEIFNIDSQVPNKVVEDALKENKIIGLENLDYIKREKTFGNSRFDIYFEKGDRKGFIEIKGVTLEENRVGMFPDAPTKRGKKHLDELIKAKNEGYESYVFFLVQFMNIDYFVPNYKMDLEFGNTLNKCEEENVQILVYNSDVGKDYIEIKDSIKYKLIR